MLILINFCYIFFANKKFYLSKLFFLEKYNKFKVFQDYISVEHNIVPGLEKTATKPEISVDREFAQ